MLDRLGRYFALMWRSKRCRSMMKYVCLVDLVKRFPILFQRVFACQNRLRYSRARASHNLDVIQFICSVHSLAAPSAGAAGRRASSGDAAPLPGLFRSGIYGSTGGDNSHGNQPTIFSVRFTELSNFLETLWQLLQNAQPSYYIYLGLAAMQENQNS